MRNVSPLQFAVLTALCLSTSALAAQSRSNPANQPTLETTTDRLNAVVVSSVDGKPVARVLVTSTDRRMAAMTDSEGRFSFDLRRRVSAQSESHIFSSYPPIPAPIAGNIPVQFILRRPGYLTDNVILHVPDTRPDTPEPTLQLRIVPAGVISGHVDPESGEPPMGTFVQLRRRQIQDGLAVWMPSGGAQINSRGEFRLADIQPGEYKIMSNSWTSSDINLLPRPNSIPGLLPSIYRDQTSVDAATPIHIGPGDTVTANLGPRVANFYHVTIPVVGLDPSNGVGTTLLPDTSGYSIGFNFQTKVIEGYLPSGSYALRIVMGSQPPASTIVHVQVNGAPVRLDPVVPVAGVDLPVVIHQEFTGERPVQRDPHAPSVFVNLQTIDGSGFSSSANPRKPGYGDDGLKIENVTEGLYRVDVYPQAGYAASVTSGAIDLLREPLAVQPGGAAAPIEITVRDDFATLSGHILLNGAQPPQSREDQPIFVLCLALDRAQAQFPSMSGVWQDNFSVPGLAPGRYLVLASHQQLTQTIEYRNQAALNDYIAKGAVVTLTAGQKAEVDVPLMPEEGN
jgi:hypothetical protein